jgi:ABC-2 type transport system ATP-binding protein
MEYVITARDLTRRFGDTLAVDHLTLDVNAGEVFGFLGHNGAGKTTTVRLLNGILNASEGSARVLGLDPIADGPALRRQTGVLTETPSLDERLTARTNLSIFADLYGVPVSQVSTQVEKLLTTFDLAERADEKVGGYSKGMKQRLALARTLLHDPQGLFLDEPTVGLDPVAARQVHGIIRRLSSSEGRTVFLCTHNLVEAQQLCDRVAVLQHGRLLALGTPGELARQVGRGQRLEIEVAPADVALTLATVQGNAEITAQSQGNGTLALHGCDRTAIPALVAELAGAGVHIYRIAPQEPSLEDVYFALTGAQGDEP